MTLILLASGADGPWRLLGRFHPMVAHFPIALLLLAGILEAVRVACRKPLFGETIGVLLTVGAVSATLAATLGWANASHGSFDDADAVILERHRWTGVVTAALALAGAILWAAARRKEYRSLRILYRVSLTFCFVAVAMTGHSGGALVFGETYLASATAKETPPVLPVAGNGGGKVDFHCDIEPILKAACLKCHGAEKQKGKFRLDGKEAAMRGGESGKAILPGHAKESPLYTMLLAAAEDDRMPKRAGPLPVAQIELIRRWIDEGAEWPDRP